MKQGICTKCGKEGKIVMHHEHGYEAEHKDDVQPYCMSCHKMIHIDARKSGRCNIPIKELAIKSMRSSYRRITKENRRTIKFSETMMPNVRLFETIQVWPNEIYIEVQFIGNHGKKLYILDI